MSAPEIFGDEWRSYTEHFCKRKPVKTVYFFRSKKDGFIEETTVRRQRFPALAANWAHVRYDVPLRFSCCVGR